MRYLKIQNDGVLDVRLVALLGGTTKANDQYKIGQFGTGLKYTIAYLFRENLDFKIFCGEEEVKLTIERENIANTDFDIVCIQGNRTSITTQMGREWTAWMIVRELWCNALDEKGESRDVVYGEDKLIGQLNTTTFYIQINSAIQDVLDNWYKYFVKTDQYMWDNHNYGIFPNGDEGKLRLYKHGVLIYEHPSVNSLFCYDIKNADINELREFKGLLHYEVFNALREPNQDVIAYFLDNIHEDDYEGSELDYSWFSTFAGIWRNTIGDRRLISSGSNWTEGVETNFEKVIHLPKKVYKALTKAFEGLGVLARTDNDADFYEAKLPETEQKVSECKSVLENAGYEFKKGLIIKIGIFSEPHLKHATSRDRKTIMLSDLVKGLSDENLMAILVEENEFIATGSNKKEPTYHRHIISKYVAQLLKPQELPIENAAFTVK